jgi:hypothetical protein
VWNEQEMTLGPAAITEISVDRQNRFVAQHSGRTVRLTAPHFERTRDSLHENLIVFLFNVAIYVLTLVDATPLQPDVAEWIKTRLSKLI